MSLKFGDQGEEIKKLQKRLQEHGFDPGPLDGVFGYQTFAAVHKLQRSCLLPATGIVDENTARLLQQVDNVESVWYYEGAFTDLQNNIADIDILVPFWFRVTEDGSVIGEVEQRVLDLAAGTDTRIHGLVSNFRGTNFSKELIDAVLENPQIRQQAAVNIVNTAQTYNLNGINLDMEFISPENRDLYTAFVQDLYLRLQAAGKELTISTPAKTTDDPENWFHGAYDYPQLAEYSTELFIMTYDYHWFGGNPGPISPAYWVRDVLNYAVSVIPANKIKLGIPVYGYDWPIEERDGELIATANADTVSFIEAIGKAQLYNASILWDDQAKEPYYFYTAEDGTRHQVYFANASSFSWRLALAQEYDLAGFAAWKLGQEDQRIWTLF